MDTPEHQALYAKGLEMRKRVVGEDYVAASLEKGKSDFMRPLQQFATVCTVHISFQFPQLPSIPFLEMLKSILGLGVGIGWFLSVTYMRNGEKGYKADQQPGISMGNNLDPPGPHTS